MITWRWHDTLMQVTLTFKLSKNIDFIYKNLLSKTDFTYYDDTLLQTFYVRKIGIIEVKYDTYFFFNFQMIFETI